MLLSLGEAMTNEKSPEQMDIGDANWQKYEAAFVKKTPEQMAKEWRHENTPASSEIDYWADKAYLAGFQKNDATVAQPLREKYKEAVEEYCRCVDEKGRVVDKYVALTAENAKLKEFRDNVKQDERTWQSVACDKADEVKALAARVSSLTAALEKIANHEVNIVQVHSFAREALKVDIPALRPQFPEQAFDVPNGEY